jgi:hypothetical protein
MTQAKDIALSAHAQALAAAEVERKAEDLRKAEEDRKRDEWYRATFDTALPTLREWFPGVEWQYSLMGNYGLDVIVTDASEVWPPSFRLRVSRTLIDMNKPNAGFKIDIEVGEYRQDTSLPGHSYFAGSKVKSAADVGRYLAAREDHKLAALERLTD